MLYRRLGVSAKATDEEVRTAYRKLALQYHPDRNGGQPSDEFREVQEAYEVLGDKERRAAYDGESKSEKARLKGFVRPDPISGTIKRPFTYKLADRVGYRFESAPDRVKCRLQAGDTLSYRVGDTDTLGVFAGIAGDGFLYWIRDGRDYAEKMCHPESDMALSSITVVQRGNLEKREVRMPASSAPGGGKRSPRSGAASGGGGGKSAAEMYATLRKKEEAKRAGARLVTLVADETEERADMESECLAKLDELHGLTTLALRSLSRSLPLARDVWTAIGFDSPPRVRVAADNGGDAEVPLSGSVYGLPPGIHEFSSPQASIVADSEHCRTPPPLSPSMPLPPRQGGTAAAPQPTSDKDAAVRADLLNRFSDGVDGLHKAETGNNNVNDDDDDGGGSASVAGFRSAASVDGSERGHHRRCDAAGSSSGSPTSTYTSSSSSSSSAAAGGAAGGKGRSALHVVSESLPPTAPAPSARPTVPPRLPGSAKPTSSPLTPPDPPAPKGSAAAPPKTGAASPRISPPVTGGPAKAAAPPPTHPRHPSGVPDDLHSPGHSGGGLLASPGRNDNGVAPVRSTGKMTVTNTAAPPSIATTPYVPPLPQSGLAAAVAHQRVNTGHSFSPDTGRSGEPLPSPLPTGTAPTAGVGERTALPSADSCDGLPGAATSLPGSPSPTPTQPPVAVDESKAEGKTAARKSVGRRTPRYMDATRSTLKRVNTLTGEEAAAGTPLAEALQGASSSGAGSPRGAGVSNNSIAHQSRVRYNNLTADELFAEEADFIKSFEQKKKVEAVIGDNAPWAFLRRRGNGGRGGDVVGQLRGHHNSRLNALGAGSL